MQVVNSGPNNVRSHNVTIFWPYETLESGSDNGKILLYLVGEPILEISGTPSSAGTKIDGHCERAPQWRDHVGILDSLNRSSNAYRKRRDDQNMDNVVDGKTSSTATATTPALSPIAIRTHTLTCDPAAQNVRCYPIYCHIPSLAAQSYYYIKLRARLWNSTLIEDYFNSYGRVDIQSYAIIHINDLLIFQSSTENDHATVGDLEEEEEEDRKS